MEAISTFSSPLSNPVQSGWLMIAAEVLADAWTWVRFSFYRNTALLTLSDIGSSNAAFVD
jgi:hypothetical protein